MTDFLDDKRSEIAKRLKELQPLVDEYNRLEAAAAALANVAALPASSAGVTPTPVRRPGRPSGSASRGRAPAASKRAAKPRGATKPRAGRRKGSGTRAAEALSVVQGQPGITIPELAAKMGIKQNYLYRVLPGLEQQRKVKRQGRTWYGWDRGGP